jgi:hypothetical protein
MPPILALLHAKVAESNTPANTPARQHTNKRTADERCNPHHFGSVDEATSTR